MFVIPSDHAYLCPTAATPAHPLMSTHPGIYRSFYLSPIGLLQINASAEGLHDVLFLEDTRQEPEAVPNAITRETQQQLDAYFKGALKAFDLPLQPQGTPFQQKVWRELLTIPFGKTTSYSTIAHRLNNPLSVRAVGTANGKNPIAIIIPCHRIIGADGSLTGYAGGLWRKEKLLALEGSRTEQPQLW